MEFHNPHIILISLGIAFAGFGLMVYLIVKAYKEIRGETNKGDYG